MCAYFNACDIDGMDYTYVYSLCNLLYPFHLSLHLPLLPSPLLSSIGVDRHLFCLYVLSRYLEVESPFLDKASALCQWTSTQHEPCPLAHCTNSIVLRVLVSYIPPVCTHAQCCAVLCVPVTHHLSCLSTEWCAGVE